MKLAFIIPSLLLFEATISESYHRDEVDRFLRPRPSSPGNQGSGSGSKRPPPPSPYTPYRPGRNQTFPAQRQRIIYIPSFPMLDSCTQNRAREEENKRIVLQYMQQLYGDKDLKAIDKFVAPDYIQHNPTVADGRDAIKAAATEWFRAGGNNKTRVDVRRVAAEGDLVWVHCSEKTADGKGIMANVDIYRVSGGKIQEHWDVIQVLEEPDRSKNPHPLF